MKIAIKRAQSPNLFETLSSVSNLREAKKRHCQLISMLHLLWKSKLLNMMRITLFFILITMNQVFAGKTYSQNARLSLHLKNASTKNILRQIEDITDFYFIYDASVVDVERKASIEATDETITGILDALFAGSNVEYKINNRQIALTVGSFTPVVSQQQKTVSGKVTDPSGAPLPGVSIIIKGTTQGTITDNDGNYSLKEVSAEGILVFSFVGMRYLEVPVLGKTSINVTMEEETIGLEEVVAVGYGTMKKVNLTGSVATASQEIFENKSVPNAIAAIQGNLPGVTVTRASGKPGYEDFDIQIRGATSANNVDALVIVDGAVGSLKDLNPNDIESISVLKDASASSIYGSNAAGGVVLVTTKSGLKNGKTIVEYSGSYGISTPAKMPELLDSWKVFEMNNLSYINATGSGWIDPIWLSWMKGEDLDVKGREGVCPNDFIPGERWVVRPGTPNLWRYFGNFDLIKLYTQKHSPVHSHNLAVRGGNEKTSYYLSAGYYNRRGILRWGPDSNERYNTRFNLETKFNKFISLNTSLAYTNENSYQPSASAEYILQLLYKIWNTEPIYLPDGVNYNQTNVWDNPKALMLEGGKDTRNNHLFDMKANLMIENVLPGLVFNLIGSKRLGLDKQFQNSRTIEYMGYNGTPVRVSNQPNSMLRASGHTDYSSLQTFATYNKTFGDSHNFSLVGGYSFEDYRYEATTAQTNNLVTNDFYSLGWSDAENQAASDNILTYATAAVFGRLNYNFKEKYLFEANVRYDGSSKLAPDVRWNLFPSFSAGWNIGRENFFPDIIIDDMKLRASWGQLGNSNALGYYDYVSMLSVASTLPFNNTQTQWVYQNQIASETKTWETIESMNIGIDFTALNRRLVFSGDYYIKKNKNMLAYLEIPSLIGISTPTYNVGELKTWGWEFSVTFKEMSKNFKYWATLNLSDNTNKLVKYEGRNIVSEGRVSLLEGYPLGTLWGYETDGLFQSDQEVEDYGVFITAQHGAGDMKYIDQNNDKRISVGSGTVDDHGDLLHLGDDNPRYQFGVNLGFSWKGFDFSCFFQGVGKRAFFVDNWDLAPMRASYKMPNKHHLDYWTLDNSDAFWPRLYANSDHSYWPSDYWLQNGAYIRLKNIEIGYTLPSSITNRMQINKARLYIAGQDLWEYDKTLSVYDPEYLDGSAQSVYPFSRTVSLGLNVTF